jgi:hypothetical protein
LRQPPGKGVFGNENNTGYNIEVPTMWWILFIGVKYNFGTFDQNFNPGKWTILRLTAIIRELMWKAFFLQKIPLLPG